MMKKLTHSLAAASMLIGAVVTTAQPAHADRRGVGIGVGIAAGIIGLGILGAANARAHGYNGGCYAGPKRCEWDGRHCYYNRFGDYVCRGGEYHCWRPTICD